MTHDQIQLFEQWALTLGVAGLIAYMGFIMYRMAKDSKAGKLGSIAIFGVLGFGILGYIIKEVLIKTMDL